MKKFQRNECKRRREKNPFLYVFECRLKDKIVCGRVVGKCSGYSGGDGGVCSNGERRAQKREIANDQKTWRQDCKNFNQKKVTGGERERKSSEQKQRRKGFLKGVCQMTKMEIECKSN